MGSADAFLRVRAESQFVWVMTFDFCALWLTSVLGAWQSARTRGGPWPVALVPFAGTAIFLALRGPHAAPATESE